MCDICGESTEKRYKLADGRGKPTELGSILESIIEMERCTEYISCACQSCKRSIHRIQKLSTEFNELKESFKEKIITVSGSIYGERHSQVRSRSPSQLSTGISPAAKKRRSPITQTPATRKELFPMQAVPSTGVLLPSTQPPAEDLPDPLHVHLFASETDISPAHHQRSLLPLLPLQVQVLQQQQASSQQQHLQAHAQPTSCNDVTVKVCIVIDVINYRIAGG